jgi:hypothetical protein
VGGRKSRVLEASPCSLLREQARSSVSEGGVSHDEERAGSWLTMSRRGTCKSVPRRKRDPQSASFGRERASEREDKRGRAVRETLRQQRIPLYDMMLSVSQLSFQGPGPPGEKAKGRESLTADLA